MIRNTEPFLYKQDTFSPSSVGKCNKCYKEQKISNAVALEK